MQPRAAPAPPFSVAQSHVPLTGVPTLATALTDAAQKSPLLSWLRDLGQQADGRTWLEDTPRRRRRTEGTGRQAIANLPTNPRPKRTVQVSDSSSCSASSSSSSRQQNYVSSRRSCSSVVSSKASRKPRTNSAPPRPTITKTTTTPVTGLGSGAPLVLGRLGSPSFAWHLIPSSPAGASGVPLDLDLGLELNLATNVAQVSNLPPPPSGHPPDVSSLRIPTTRPSPPHPLTSPVPMPCEHQPHPHGLFYPCTTTLGPPPVLNSQPQQFQRLPGPEAHHPPYHGYYDDLPPSVIGDAAQETTPSLPRAQYTVAVGGQEQLVLNEDYLQASLGLPPRVSETVPISASALPSSSSSTTSNLYYNDDSHWDNSRVDSLVQPTLLGSFPQALPPSSTTTADPSLTEVQNYGRPDNYHPYYPQDPQQPHPYNFPPYPPPLEEGNLADYGDVLLPESFLDLLREDSDGPGL